MKKKAGKKSAKTPSALDVLLNGAAQRTDSLSSLTDQFSSVMSLARADIPRLMKQNPQMHISEARDVHARAQAMSVVIARQFREQRLTASVRQANTPPTGIKGLVDGPTYTDMFNPDWANHCPPDAIEATTSPVAYLADLYRYAQELEATGNEAEVIPLNERRPDLKDLVLDHTALNRVEPTIVLVNEILEKSIRTHLDGIGLEEKSVDDALLEARYPNALPFERYTSQINYALGRKDRTLGDAIRAADPAYPYFKETGVHSLLSDTVLIQDTGLGPVQQGLLLEAPYFPATEDSTHSPGVNPWRMDPRSQRLILKKADDEAPTRFYLDNFGVASLLDLEDTQTFCLRTGLSTDDLDALLSVGAYAPSRSANVPGEDDIDASLSGSVYINAGLAPAMSIETQAGDTQKGVGARHRIINLTPDRLDRMNRMIRLARWLDIRFDEVDLLLVASMQAEQRAATLTRRVKAEAHNPWLITQDTLRALGLFQVGRRLHGLLAEDFAVLLYGLTVYGRGKTASQFDRVFNDQALFSMPLILDEAPFTALPKTEAERQKIDHLCAALGMTFEVYRFVVKAVEQSLAGEPLRWSREVVSAFYRLVRLPRYLDLGTVETLALLELLDEGGSHLVSKVAGVSQIASYYASGNTDTLSVIHASVNAVAWLREHRWSIAQLCNMVLPSLTRPVATEAEQELLQHMQSRLTSALITDSSFAEVGTPHVSVAKAADDQDNLYASEPIDWFALLSNFIDDGSTMSTSKGLVKYLTGETEETFESALSAEVSKVLASVGLPVEELHPKITNMIMRARGAQEALLMEGLGGYLGVSADLARVLLFWSGGNRHQVLKEVLRVYGAHPAGQVAIGDEVLIVLEALVKEAALVTHLRLSAAFIAQLLEAPQWFGLSDAKLSMQLIYFSSQYSALLRLSEQSEDSLLDYLRLINTLWGSATEGDKRLIRDSASNRLASFLKWGVREVLDVAYALNPEGIVFTLKDLDTVARLSQLSRQTGLDANALLALSRLVPTSPVEAYRQAAEKALSSLIDKNSSTQEEAGQSRSSAITVTPDYLVAKRPEDKATYTITLRDVMGEPFKNVTVGWSTTLGELDQLQTTTDENGATSTTLKSGAVMGVAAVVASFGLGEQLKAPVVTIDCDEASIDFEGAEIGPTEALSNKLEPVLCSVALVDKYANKAIDRPVEWFASLGEFQRYQTYTDHDGVARAELVSGPAGVSEVMAKYRNGAVEPFNPVEFISHPYFQYVKFMEVAVVGIKVSVTCSLVELNGTPRANEVITWTALDEDGKPFGTLTGSGGKTDAQGIATVTFLADTVGHVRVTATANALTPKPTKTSELTAINPQAEIIRQATRHDDFLVGNSDPEVFSVWVAAGETPAVGALVSWTTAAAGKARKKADAVTSRTDRDGKATYSAKFTEGNHVVTATLSGTSKSVKFNVLARKQVEFEITFDGELLDPLSPDLISRIAEYECVIKVVDRESRTPLAGVSFEVDFVDADPQLMGLYIAGLGKKYKSAVEGIKLKVSSNSGDRGTFTLQTKTGYLLEELHPTYRLGWIYKYSSATLRSGGVLDLKWICVVTDLDPYDGAVIDPLGAVEFSVPAKNIKVVLPVKLDGRPLHNKIPDTSLPALANGDVTTTSRLVALDGYLVMLPGTQPLTNVSALRSKRTKT
ncbi:MULTISPECIES: Tc toxin subunit A [unclassified Pseudomonas]|uniref:Tc toxin subunit A n=1 Tax=unclassified Pseudomonas TaxID=196821 RepID=UPI000D384A58|nr:MULTISPECIES: Tc toxin subunit A [unclassified Pseudomonas]RAU45802.1 hypothetical protein DBP26_012545 [Pseudomonas sp. RIT 409]RAU56099.1 hypothetical protein DBY65_002950 [Pseudomonas sp. RIT 412]